MLAASPCPAESRSHGCCGWRPLQHSMLASLLEKQPLLARLQLVAVCKGKQPSAASATSLLLAPMLTRVHPPNASVCCAAQQYVLDS